MPCGCSQSPQAQPGAAAPNCSGTAVLWFAGGMIVGSLLTVAFINYTGETSVRGLAKKTVEYTQKGVAFGQKTLLG